MTSYFFVSFGSPVTRKAIGACIVEANESEEALDKCIALGLVPDEAHQVRLYPLSEEERASDPLELDRYYSRPEMEAMGY